MKTNVERIAQLARLSLSEEEKEKFSLQLDSIFAYVGKLNELDTSGIEPTSHVLKLINVMREDKQKPSLSREDALRNSSENTGEFFKVPKIIE